MANITLALKYTRRFVGVNEQGAYDFISIPAKTGDGKWAEVSLTPTEYDGIAGSIGVLDRISFPNAVIEPRKDGSVDRNGNPRLVATVDWAEAEVKRAPFKSTMPSLDTLGRLAADRVAAAAKAESPIGEGAIA